MNSMGRNLNGGATLLADVAPRQVEWLWPRRIALGKLTLLAGDPEVGKSYLTLDIAARVSRGGPWPEATGITNDEASLSSIDVQPSSFANSSSGRADSTAGSVILLSAEDDASDTIRSRLDALGADLDKCMMCFDADGSRTFDLAANLKRLERSIRASGNCRLIVVDPIGCYLGNISENSGSDSRRLLSPLAELAAKYHLAIVLVTHLRKSAGPALHRAIGSVSFTAVARTAWVVSGDPQQPERRLLLPMKRNLNAATTGLAFTFLPVGSGDYATIRWAAEPVTASADDTLEELAATPPRHHKLCDAMAWLEQYLADGPAPAGEIQEVAKTRGTSYGTLRRAYCALGIESKKVIRDGTSIQMWQLGPKKTAAD
jgi:putative DNA primase/helicase